MNASGSTPQFGNASCKAKVLCVKERGVVPPVLLGAEVGDCRNLGNCRIGASREVVD